MIHIQLKIFLKKEKITQQELANKTNMSLRAVQKYIKGETKPDAGFLNTLLEKYNLNINWLLSGKWEMYNKPVLTAYVSEPDIAYAYNELSIEEKALSLDLISVIRRRKSMGRLLTTIVDINRDSRESGE